MKTRIIAFVLACILLFSCTAFAEELPEPVFTFRNGITWGMSAEEVLSTEPFDVNDDIVISDRYRLVNYGKVPVSNTEADLGCFFCNDSLVISAYDLYSADDAEFEYLNGALTSVYGEGSPTDGRDLFLVLCHIDETSVNENDYRHVTGWDADGTSIYLFRYAVDGIGIMYVCPNFFEVTAAAEGYNTSGL